MLGLSIL
jgi:hypothetical protein